VASFAEGLRSAMLQAQQLFGQVWSLASTCLAEGQTLLSSLTAQVAPPIVQLHDHKYQLGRKVNPQLPMFVLPSAPDDRLEQLLQRLNAVVIHEHELRVIDKVGRELGACLPRHP
jgi:hypothetical protein